MKNRFLIIVVAALILITGCMEKKKVENTEFKESKQNGYIQKEFSVPVKRYCLSLELKDNSDLIEEYKIDGFRFLLFFYCFCFHFFICGN